MPAILSQEQMDISDRESVGGGVYTMSRDHSFRNGEWEERNIVETAVILTEPRAEDKMERDDGDSGISDPAVEERLLPTASRTKENGDGSLPEYNNGQKKESVLETLVQVFFPFMIAGFGMMAAGLLLDEVQVLYLCNS